MNLQRLGLALRSLGEHAKVWVTCYPDANSHPVWKLNISSAGQSVVGSADAPDHAWDRAHELVAEESRERPHNDHLLHLMVAAEQDAVQ